MTVIGMGAVTVAAQETETETPTATDATTTAAGTATAAGNATATATAQTANVTFGNQSTNGTYVVINRTVLPEGGFIAVFTVNESAAANATPTAGTATTTASTATTTTATTATATATTATATTAGTATEDASLTETPANGTATAGGTTTAAGATPTPQANVTATPVTISEVNESALGMFVGNSTYLQPGTHQNVTVQYRTNLRQVNDQVLIAVAYQDAGENRTFDGVENSTAYVANGSIVGDEAHVTVLTGANATTPTPTATASTATATEAGAVNVTENGTATDGGLVDGNETETESGNDTL